MRRQGGTDDTVRSFFLFLGAFLIMVSSAQAGERAAESCVFTGTLDACETNPSLLCIHQEDFDHELVVQCTGDMVAQCANFTGETVRLQAVPYLFALDIVFEVTRIVNYGEGAPDINRCRLEGELNELFTPDLDVEQFYHLYKIEAHRNLDLLCPEGVNGTECVPCIDQQVELGSHVLIGAEGPYFVVHDLDC